MLLTGTTSDRRTNVQCELTFDPSDCLIHTHGIGRILALPAIFKLFLQVQVGTPYPYKEGDVRLLSLHGALGAENSTWNAILPQHTVTENQPQGSITFTVPCSDADIEAIETARAGGDVMFHLFVAGMAQVSAKQQPTINIHNTQEPVMLARQSDLVPISGDNQRGMGGSGWSFRIAREHWLKILHSAGRPRYLVELPVPDLPEPQKAWGTTIQYLQAAVDAHRQGHYEEALKRCRQVVEGVATILGQQWNVPQGSKKYSAWVNEISERLVNTWPKEDKGQAKMIGGLLDGAWAWTSPSHHYGSGVPAREEAAFAVHLATALLSFAAQVLQAHPEPVTEAAE